MSGPVCARAGIRYTYLLPAHSKFCSVYLRAGRETIRILAISKRGHPGVRASGGYARRKKADACRALKLDSGDPEKKKFLL